MQPLRAPDAQSSLVESYRAGVAQVLAISDEIGVYTELEDIVRRGVELARERLKVERLAIFLYERGGIMQGTFGTGAAGETLDERWLAFTVSPDECQRLKHLVHRGDLWHYLHDVELRVPRPRGALVIGRGWNTATPLLSAGKVVGVMHADAAISGSAFDPVKQTHLAVLGATLANLIHASRFRSSSDRAGRRGEPTRLVRRALAALDENADVRGRDLARAFGVDPGHFARVFKADVGVSLVEYKNRLRLRHFFRVLEQGEVSLAQAAKSAGFRSYAQFHRVYRQLIGSTPRDIYTSSRK